MSVIYNYFLAWHELLPTWLDMTYCPDISDHRILCYFVIIIFYKSYVVIIILFNFFFHEKYFYLFMFRDVPGCSGMFRNVPCSGFYRRPWIQGYYSGSKVITLDPKFLLFIQSYHFGSKVITPDPNLLFRIPKLLSRIQSYCSG